MNKTLSILSAIRSLLLWQQRFDAARTCAWQDEHMSLVILKSVLWSFAISWRVAALVCPQRGARPALSHHCGWFAFPVRTFDKVNCGGIAAYKICICSYPALAGIETRNLSRVRMKQLDVITENRTVGDTTRVQYEWTVVVAKWMRAFTPLLRRCLRRCSPGTTTR